MAHLKEEDTYYEFCKNALETREHINSHTHKHTNTFIEPWKIKASPNIYWVLSLRIRYMKESGTRVTKSKTNP